MSGFGIADPENADGTANRNLFRLSIGSKYFYIVNEFKSLLKVKKPDALPLWMEKAAN